MKTQTPQSTSYDVVIIGGAMMGASAAWFLSDDKDFDGKGPLSPAALRPPPATAKIWLAVTPATVSAIVSLAGGGVGSISSV